MVTSVLYFSNSFFIYPAAPLSYPEPPDIPDIPVKKSLVNSSLRNKYSLSDSTLIEKSSAANTLIYSLYHISLKISMQLHKNIF